MKPLKLLLVALAGAALALGLVGWRAIAQQRLALGRGGGGDACGTCELPVLASRKLERLRARLKVLWLWSREEGLRDR